MIVRLCFALLAFLLGTASAGQALAFSLADAQVTRTLTHGNLSVHLLSRNGGGPAPLTLHQAAERGLARVHVAGKQIVVSNAATASVFIQAGTLLTGATQDQVVLQTLIVAPGAKNIPLNTFCVESRRSTARPGTSDTEYMPVQALAPLPEVARSRLAENGPDSKRESVIRQFGIWLTIDALRSKLAATVEAPALDNSLAHLVDNPAIERAIRPAVAALSGVDGSASGAVIMIGDRVVGLEAYASPALFAAQWPRLLRAYAIEALVAPAAAGEARDRLAKAAAFLEQARQVDAAADAWLGSSGPTDARAVYRSVAGEPYAATIDLARTQEFVAETLRTIAPSPADHPRILAMLRAVHDQADGSVGAMRDAVRQILVARMLPNLNAVKELIALGEVRPAPRGLDLPPVLIVIVLGMIALFVRRKQLSDKAAQTAAQALRVATPETNRTATVQALLRDAVAAAERYARARNAAVPTTSTASESPVRTTPYVSRA